MLSSQQQPKPQPQEGYNGIVTVAGENVSVKNGIAQYGGDTYYVSNDGDIVAEANRNIVGYIKDGEFKPLDNEHITLLKSKGMLEE